jgi:hypothetical protein
MKRGSFFWKDRLHNMVEGFFVGPEIVGWFPVVFLLELLPEFGNSILL